MSRRDNIECGEKHAHSFGVCWVAEEAGCRSVDAFAGNITYNRVKRPT
jgi:hypothetical protein